MQLNMGKNWIAKIECIFTNNENRGIVRKDGIQVDLSVVISVIGKKLIFSD